MPNTVMLVVEAERSMLRIVTVKSLLKQLYDVLVSIQCIYVRFSASMIILCPTKGLISYPIYINTYFFSG